MHRSIARRGLAFSLCGLLILAASAAHADPIPYSYAVTDLGPASEAPAYPIGNTVASYINGYIYPFPQSFQGTELTGSALANVPIAELFPGGPNATSMVASATLYPNGTALAVDHVVFNDPGSSESSRNDLYLVRHNPDGTWGQPVILSFGTQQAGNPPNDVQYALSKSGVVAYSQLDITRSTWSATVENLTTKAVTDVGSILGSGSASVRVTAIDDEGRLLVQGGPSGDERYLLTPAGVSSDPIQTPEPGSMAVMGLAIAAFAVYRLRRNR